MSTSTPRQPKGIPVGGQFAATTHTEPSVSLGAPTVAPEYVGTRLKELGLSAHLNLDQLDEIASRLNDSKDFTDRNIQTVADELHLRAHGYSASKARDAEEGLRILRAAGNNDQADALEAVTDARLANARGAAKEFGAHRAEPLPDGKTIPVPHDDPRLQAGEVFDRVLAEDQVFNHSSVSGYPQDTQSIRFQANRPLTDAEAYALSGVVGYANRSAIGGEALDNPAVGPSRDTPFSFIAHIDTNKGRQGDFQKFEAMIPDIIANGSQLRPTKGNTRAIEAFGDPDLKLEVYYAE
ncbi:hypothetical protein [Arthrobacter sp. UYCo732]|uniref:hypothetical protein n=1 Tax=Arthrobacter sp. UYCo732 TaxID=3156336 RepID=UPI00339718FE